jgi:oxygen-independent coproporphyrinogen-3 oxidase
VSQLGAKSGYGFTTEYVRSFIDKESVRRQSNKVLHGHPSPLHWKPLETPMEELLDERAGYGMKTRHEVNLYVGTPFCIKTKPARCGFCLFPSEDYEGTKGVEAYLDYLKREFDMYKPFYSDDTLSSIYFGGGTPNLYRPQHYGRIMEYVDNLYGGVPSGIEITLEGIPQLFNEEKLKAISEAGFNRVSMGVQQLNDDLIKYSGRRQNRQQVFSALEYCHKYDLANSLDLIYGWPEQTIGNMLDDLKTAVDAGVHHITHYELNVAGRSDFAAPSKRALLPSIETNIEMYHASKEYLLSAGFEQVTVYDWRRKPADDQATRLSSYDYEHNLHDFIDKSDGQDETTVQQMCGIGFAAVNFHPNSIDPNDRNWVYMNQTSLKNYCEDIDAGKFPVSRGFMYNHHDIKLVWMFQSMQTMKINFANYMSIFNENLLDTHSAIWEELDRRGWLSVGKTELSFVGDGQYYIPMIQSLLASMRVAEIRNERKQSLETIGVVVE